MFHHSQNSISYQTIPLKILILQKLQLNLCHSEQFLLKCKIDVNSFKVVLMVPLFIAGPNILETDLAMKLLRFLKVGCSMSSFCSQILKIFLLSSTMQASEYSIML